MVGWTDRSRLREGQTVKVTGERGEGQAPGPSLTTLVLLLPLLSA